MNIKPPIQTQKISENEMVERNWYLYFNAVAGYISQVSQSGTTAERPTKNLFIGMPYYDTTLGYHVNVSSINPLVWKNEAGATV